MDIYQTKCCNRCNINKSIIDFHKNKSAKDSIRSICKECVNKTTESYRNNNRDKIKQYNKSNEEHIKVYQHNYRLKNKKRLSDKKKEYQSKNRHRITQYQTYKRKTDTLFGFACSIRSRIRAAFRSTGKAASTETILGCCINEFYTYIENQFLPNMSWDNRNEWHLDHIVPVSFGETIEEITLLNHYSNFRPLWANDNLSKHKKLSDESRLHPLYIIISNNRLMKM